jgi:hypothetical protein
VLHAIANLIAACGGHDHKPSIAGNCPEFPFERQNEMAALAPVISGAPRGVRPHPHRYISNLLRTPKGHARRAGVLDWRYLRPINGGELNIFDPHGAWVYQRHWCRDSRRSGRAEKTVDRRVNGSGITLLLPNPSLQRSKPGPFSSELEYIEALRASW